MCVKVEIILFDVICIYVYERFFWEMLICDRNVINEIKWYRVIEDMVINVIKFDICGIIYFLWLLGN